LLRAISEDGDGALSTLDESENGNDGEENLKEKQGFLVASSIDGLGAPTETPRFVRLEALMQLRRLYRSMALIEQIVGKEDVNQSKAGKKPTPVQELKAYLEEYCNIESWDPQAMDASEETNCDARKMLEAVNTCVKLDEDSLRMQALVRGMEERGYFDLLWGGEGDGKPEEVKNLLKRRVDVFSQSVAKNIDEIVELTPGETLLETKDEVEKLVLGQSEAEGSQVGTRLGLVGNTVRSSVSSAKVGLTEELGQLRREPLEKMKDTGTYLKGVWVRLNGGEGENVSLVPDLPHPPLQKQETQARQVELTLEINEREREFKEVSREREIQLRKQGVLDRARQAAQLRAMDVKVDTLRRALVVITLELQMLFVFATLEEEASEVTASSQFRDKEVELFVAEFGLLDARLSQLAVAVDDDEAIVIDDDYLAALATDIPDLKVRLGLLDDPTAPALDVSWQRVRRQFEEGKSKVGEGVGFISRAVRLLGGDVWYSLALIGRALQGNSLKTREVLALRRTSRDLLTFPLFAAILIAPLTPVGHVLIFSFMQQYFPGLFPSQFAARRQELLQRYEELTKQLREAETSWMSDSERGALIAAERAVSAILQNDAPGNVLEGDENQRLGGLRQALKSAEYSTVEFSDEEGPENEGRSVKK